MCVVHVNQINLNLGTSHAVANISSVTWSSRDWEGRAPCAYGA